MFNKCIWTKFYTVWEFILVGLKAITFISGLNILQHQINAFSRHHSRIFQETYMNRIERDMWCNCGMTRQRGSYIYIYLYRLVQLRWMLTSLSLGPQTTEQGPFWFGNHRSTSRKWEEGTENVQKMPQSYNSANMSRCIYAIHAVRGQDRDTQMTF